MKNNINRRNFIKVSAMGSATVAAAGCSPDPVEELIPLLVTPYEYVPGESIHYATTCQECSAAWSSGPVRAELSRLRETQKIR